jgi:hypothetical protein
MYDPMVESYERFYRDNGYFPKMFNAYNCQEVTDIAPTVTTSCGSWFCTATVSILVEDKDESDSGGSTTEQR